MKILLAAACGFFGIQAYLRLIYIAHSNKAFFENIYNICHLLFRAARNAPFPIYGHILVSCTNILSETCSSSMNHNPEDTHGLNLDCFICAISKQKCRLDFFKKNYRNLNLPNFLLQMRASVWQGSTSIPWAISAKYVPHLMPGFKVCLPCLLFTAAWGEVWKHRARISWPSWADKVDKGITWMMEGIPMYFDTFCWNQKYISDKISDVVELLSKSLFLKGNP